MGTSRHIEYFDSNVNQNLQFQEPQVSTFTDAPSHAAYMFGDNAGKRTSSLFFFQNFSVLMIGF